MSYYATLTVDNTKVGGSSGSLSNFPVLVSGTYAGASGKPDLRSTANGGNVESTSGYDILFYNDASKTTKYDHELISYTATTGAFIAWVRIPTLNKGSDTTYYMHYGDDSITTDQSTANTWTSYVAKYPLESNANDSAGSANATLVGSPSFNAGKIANAIDFGTNNTNKYAAYTSDNIFSYSQFSTAWSVNGWYNFNSTAQDFNFLFWVRTTDGTSIRQGGVSYITAGDFQITSFPNGSNGQTSTNITYSISTGTFYMITFTYDGSSFRLYVNGQYQGSSSHSSWGTYNLNDKRFDIGAGNTSYPFNGRIDELFVTTTTLTDEWITTEYNTQNDPATFYSVGDETSSGSPSVLRVNIGQTGYGVRIV